MNPDCKKGNGIFEYHEGKMLWKRWIDWLAHSVRGPEPIADGVSRVYARSATLTTAVVPTNRRWTPAKAAFSDERLAARMVSDGGRSENVLQNP